MSAPTPPSPLASAIALLEQELARLKEELEIYRLTDAADKDVLVRERVAAIDERTERLVQLKRMSQTQH